MSPDLAPATKQPKQTFPTCFPPMKEILTAALGSETSRMSKKIVMGNHFQSSEVLHPLRLWGVNHCPLERFSYLEFFIFILETNMRFWRRDDGDYITVFNCPNFHIHCPMEPKGNKMSFCVWEGGSVQRGRSPQIMNLVGASIQRLHTDPSPPREKLSAPQRLTILWKTHNSFKNGKRDIPPPKYEYLALGIKRFIPDL